MYSDIFKNQLIAVLIFVLFIMLRKVFTEYIFTSLIKLLARLGANLGEGFLQAFKKPLSFGFIVLGFYIAMQYWLLSPPYYLFLIKIVRSSIILIVTWGLCNLTSSQSNFSEEIKLKLNIDDILIQFFSKIIRFIIIAIGILMVAQEFNYDVNGFIAGLGLGGLAFALAAKDALANIFGGIVIIMEKPFLIGDWIKTSSGEGTVEEITFRSTKLRAFDQSVITVPNSSLANEPITNFSRMGKRRISFYLSLARTTSVSAIDNCVKKIKTLLKNHPEIHPETILVNFEKFNDSSLDIYLYFFTNSTVWSEHLEVKQDVNFKILNILEEENISLAYPTQKIFTDNKIITSK